MPTEWAESRAIYVGTSANLINYQNGRSRRWLFKIGSAKDVLVRQNGVNGELDKDRDAKLLGDDNWKLWKLVEFQDAKIADEQERLIHREFQARSQWLEPLPAIFPNNKNGETECYWITDIHLKEFFDDAKNSKNVIFTNAVGRALGLIYDIRRWKSAAGGIEDFVYDLNFKPSYEIRTMHEVLDDADDAQLNNETGWIEE